MPAHLEGTERLMKKEAGQSQGNASQEQVTPGGEQRVNGSNQTDESAEDKDFTPSLANPQAVRPHTQKAPRGRAKRKLA